MNINDAFPSAFIKSDDLQGQRIPLTVMTVTMEDVGDKEYKACLRFMGKDKGMILNKTNAGILAAAWGNDTDHWQGQKLELYSHMVNFQGRMVPGLAVQPLNTQQPQQPMANGNYPATGNVAQQPAHPAAQPGPHDQRAAEIAQEVQEIGKVGNPPTGDVNMDDIPF